MEFWSSEVKSGETFKVKPGRGMILHLSQASLGEVKKVKSNESVYLFVNVDGEKLVLGTLSSEKLPQLQFDLVFDRDFELYHSWKGGSVYFFGYRMENSDECGEDEDERDESDSDSSSEDEDMPLIIENIGKPEIKVKEEKPADTNKVEKDSSTNKKAGVETDNGLPKSEDDDSSDDDDSVSDDDDTDVDEDEDDEDESEEDEDESEEDEPAKADPGKKRASDTEPETPATKKKSKLTTPEKTDGKKGSGVHVDTPHPSKKAVGKTSATENQKTAKSSGGGSHMCKSCSRTFGSGSGLDSHTKAKHGADK